MKQLSFIFAFILALAIAIFYTLQNPTLKPEPIPVDPVPLPIERPIAPSEPVACTMDAKRCPDGSFVGRVPPNCDFAPCM